MQDSIYIILGIVIGLLVSIPGGPVNILCAHRAARLGFWASFFAGLGAAIADGMFATIAAFGISTIHLFIDTYQIGIQLVGGILLLIFGWQASRMRPDFEDDGQSTQNNLINGLISAFVMTITNPGTIFGMLALFSALGEWAPQPGDYRAAGMSVFGVLLGATSWWALLAGGVTKLSRSFNDEKLQYISHISGIIIAACGFFILIRLAWLHI